MLAAVAIVAATLLVYWPSLPGGFIWDDDVLLTGNRLVQSPEGLQKIWFSADQPDYFPLTATSFWIEWRLWGQNPTGYRVTNILLHAIGAILLWRVLRRLTVPGAWVAALLFAVHPLSVASVAWIAERKNTLSLVFFTLTLLFYLRSEENITTASRRLRPAHWYVLALAAFLLALLSKTSVAMLPLVLLGIALWQRGSLAKMDFLKTAPFFALALVFGLVTIWFQHHQSSGGQAADTFSFLEKTTAAGRAVWFYLAKTFWPAHLSMIYPKWTPDISLLGWLPVILLMIAAAACRKFRHSWGKHAALALGYFTLMLLPVLGFVDMYYLNYSRVADHWAYLSIIGVTALVSAALFQFIQNGRARQVAVAALAIPLAVLSWNQNRLFGNPERLWRDTLEKNPTTWAAHRHLAHIYVELDQFEAAVKAFHEALRLNPDSHETCYNLANAYLSLERFADAAQWFREAIRLKPDYAKAQYNLALAYEKLNQPEEARLAYLAAINSNPRHASAHNNLSILLHRMGRLEEAATHARRALEIEPASVEALNNLGNLHVAEGRFEEAATFYRKAIELKPDYADAHGNLAVTLQQKGDLEEALFHYQKAVRLRPEYPVAHFNIGCALQSLGRLAEARGSFHTALQQRPGLYQAHLHLAQLCVAEGDIASATMHLKAALQINPGYTEAREELEKLDALQEIKP